MRVAFLSPLADLGGAERVLLDLLWSLRACAADIEPHLLLPSEGPLGDRATALGVACQSCRCRRASVGPARVTCPAAPPALWSLARQSLTGLPAAVRYVRRLRQALAAIRPAIVHSNGVKTHLASAAAQADAKVVWHVHDFLTTRPLTARLLSLAGRSVGGVIAVSDAVAADTRQLLPGRPVVAVPNAIDLDRFIPAAVPADLDKLAGAAPEPRPLVRVGLVATYATWKGHEIFLDCAGRLLTRRPDLPLQFYIVGGPIYQTRAQWSPEQVCRRLAERRGVLDRVRFVPFQPNPASIYAALDIVVHASTRPEPFGLTIAEAMACGRAVIVSRAGGAAELFTDGHDAVGVTPGDAAGLSDAIERLATDTVFRRELGRNARQTAARRFRPPAARAGCLNHLSEGAFGRINGCELERGSVGS